MAIPKSEEKAFKERFEEYTQTLDCVHCGLCIPDCPTQGITGRESDSPRGRIYLMRGYAEESIPFTPESLKHLDQCIVCRNCETVCPSGIQMGEMMETFRHEMNRTLPHKGWKHHFMKLMLNHVVPSRAKIAFLLDLLYYYDRFKLRKILVGVGSKFSKKLKKMDRLFPPIPKPSERRLATSASIPQGLYPSTQGKARMKVGLFLGCITSELFVETHRSTIRMLNRSGCDVYVPDSQTCCGALHRHGGFIDEAHRLYEGNVSAFEESGVDVIIVNAAGCGAALKEPPSSLPDGLGRPVRDICEFLEEIGIPEPDQKISRKVAYDQPCHLVHGQKVPASAVLSLLEQVPGLEIVPLRNSERCCGSGGIYNLLHPEMAEPILDEKVEDILDSGADTIVTGNPGCWMQIRSGLLDKDIEVLHPVDLLDQAYGA